MKKGLVAVLIAALAAFVGHRFIKLRELTLGSRELPLRHLPNCHLLNNIEQGAEDITILRDGLAILSTGLKYPGMPFTDDPGKIYTLDLLDSRLTPVELKIKGQLDIESFNPHGISVFTDNTDGSVYLFVVNHPQHKSQIEIFRLVEEENTIVHLKTVTHSLLHSVNDIVAVGVESFYATNECFYAFPSEVLHLLTMLLGLPWCNVIYYSPEEVKEVAGGFLSANGINMSPDERYLYVADVAAHDIQVFERQPGEQLVYIKAVAVGSLCDNIDVDHETGDLWLGCHPNGLKLMVLDPKDPPGSEVIRIQNIHSEQPTMTQVYADNGSVIIGSSVAAPYGGKLLIGTVYHKALCCDLEK